MNKRKDLKWNFPQSFIRGGGHGHGHGHDPEHDKELFRKMTYYQLKEKPIDLILERKYSIADAIYRWTLQGYWKLPCYATAVWTAYVLYYKWPDFRAIDEQNDRLQMQQEQQEQ